MPHFANASPSGNITSQEHATTSYLRYALPVVALAVFLLLSFFAGVYSHLRAPFVLARRHDHVASKITHSYFLTIKFNLVNYSVATLGLNLKYFSSPV